MERVTPITLKKMKGAKEKITSLTAYDYPTALLLDEVGIDVILVGDSVGMVMLGYETTLPVGMEEMLHHTRAVARGVKRALVVGDMPFLSFQTGVEKAVENAGLFLKAGAQAVKLEGGSEILPVIDTLISFGIPVMGHLGLTPMKIHSYGGYKAQGRTVEAARRIFNDARQLDSAGVFSIVLESIPWKLAKAITEGVGTPTIGIGSGPYCDGQVLVFHDAMGLTPGYQPRHVKKFLQGQEIFRTAVKSYMEEVRSGDFPSPAHSFEMKDFDPEFLRGVQK